MDIDRLCYLWQFAAKSLIKSLCCQILCRWWNGQCTMLEMIKDHYFYWNTNAVSLWSAVPQSKVVQICIVRCLPKKSSKSGSKGCRTKRSRLEDSYKRTEVWALQDLTLIDGRDPDVVSSLLQICPISACCECDAVSFEINNGINVLDGIHTTCSTKLCI